MDASWLRDEDPRLLTGGGRFLDDISPAGAVWAAFVRSPHAHAAIGEIDASDALKGPGVLGVLTGDDYRSDGMGHLPCQDACTRRDGAPMVVPLHPALPSDRARFVGEPVAMVLADTQEAARDAAEAVSVGWGILPPVLAAGDVPPIHDGYTDNEAFFARAGDPDRTDGVFEMAAHVVEQTLLDQRVAANPMEPRGYIGSYDGATGRFTLRGGVHSPHILRRQLAEELFRLPAERFRIVTGDVGGSFGMRGAIYPELVLVLWAARRLGRPVKWVATRSEALTGDDHGRDIASTAALALNDAGDFLGLRVAMTANLGAWLGVKGPRSPLNALNLMSAVYRFPEKDVSVRGCFTNTNPVSPYRGAGGPEASLIVERLIDKAAREAGFDRIELRRRNLIRPGDMPYDTGLGLVYDSGDFPAVMEKAVALADVGGFADRRAHSASRGRLRGLGVCNAIEQTARPGLESAAISVAEDGKATVRVGTASQGQGHETLWRRLVCDGLRLSPADIEIIDGDTDGLADGGGTFNSRSAVGGGMAVTGAIGKIVERGRAVAADLLEAAVADIEFSDGRFVIAGTDRAATLQDVAAAGALSETADYSPDSPTFPNGTHICEVELDPETGRVEVVSYAAVDDVGAPLNPVLLKGQIQGGVAQGIGQALVEAISFDLDSGQNLSGSFMDYAMPRADDLCFIATEDHPVPTLLNALGAKGAGEAGTVGALPAAICAVCDALGTDDVPMPATQESVWRVLTNAHDRGGKGA